MTHFSEVEAEAWRGELTFAMVCSKSEASMWNCVLYAHISVLPVLGSKSL